MQLPGPPTVMSQREVGGTSAPFVKPAARSSLIASITVVWCRVIAARIACHALVLTRSSKAGKLWQASQNVVGRRDLLKPLLIVKIENYLPGYTYYVWEVAIDLQVDA
jgi:hypothetical protein